MPVVAAGEQRRQNLEVALLARCQREHLIERGDGHLRCAVALAVVKEDGLHRLDRAGIVEPRRIDDVA